MLKPPRIPLIGAYGDSYTPQGGLADRQWGQENISRARFNEAVDQIAQARPGHRASQLGQPNGPWDSFNGLMMGLRDGGLAAGKSLRTNYAPSLAAKQPYDTRWDGDQVDPRTGHTLTEDTYAGRPDLQTPLYRLRQLYGLK